MRNLNPLFDPYVNIREALAGSGYRIVFRSSRNEGDRLRGEFFMHMREHFPASFFVDEKPPRKPTHSCLLYVVRNPSPAVAEGLVRDFPRPCGCRLIVDVSAPFWGGFDVTWTDGAEPAGADALVAGVKAAAAVADVVTVPWAKYAEALREHEGLNAMHVPDSVEDDEAAQVQHALAWTSAVMAARNQAR